MLMILTIGCEQQTRKQIAETLGRAQMKRIEKNVNSRIQEMVVPMLKYPESYQPISTDMSIVTSDMIIYDSDAFIALRDLNHAIKNFHEEYGNDSSSQAAIRELNVIQAIADVVQDRVNVINNRPVKFEGIDAYHQFYADDRHGHQVKKGYHFIIHKDNRITLLCDQDEFLQVKDFIKQVISNDNYHSI